MLISINLVSIVWNELMKNLFNILLKKIKNITMFVKKFYAKLAITLAANCSFFLNKPLLLLVVMEKPETQIAIFSQELLLFFKGIQLIAVILVMQSALTRIKEYLGIKKTSISDTTPNPESSNDDDEKDKEKTWWEKTKSWFNRNQDIIVPIVFLTAIGIIYFFTKDSLGIADSDSDSDDDPTKSDDKTFSPNLPWVNFLDIKYGRVAGELFFENLQEYVKRRQAVLNILSIQITENQLTLPESINEIFVNEIANNSLTVEEQYAKENQTDNIQILFNFCRYCNMILDVV